MTGTEFQGGGFVLSPSSVGSKRDCSSSAFPINITGEQCQGLSSDGSGNSSPEACRTACCSNANCKIWQWCKPGTGEGCGCFVDADGKADPCGPTVSGGPWVGQAKAPPSFNVTSVRIQSNIFSGAGKASIVTKSVSLAAGSAETPVTVKVNFCPQLIFPSITEVSALTFALSQVASKVTHSTVARGPTDGSAVSNVVSIDLLTSTTTGCTVTVVSKTTYPTVITITADTSTRVDDCYLC